jgi:anti-anti-sigma regulatory factor
MAMGSRKDRMKIREEDGVTILNLGPVEIWDGADLALLRDTFTQHCVNRRCRSLGIDMSSVKYVPSGFFGMLFDWHEKGVSIRLYSPQPRVANMLWFRQFFEPVTNGAHLLQDEPKELIVFDEPGEWDDEEVWVEEPQPVAGFQRQ